MPAPIRPVVLLGARLLDGRSPDAIADGVLLTDDQGRIVAAGPSSPPRCPMMRADRPDRSHVAAGIIDCPFTWRWKLEPVHEPGQRPRRT